MNDSLHKDLSVYQLAAGVEPPPQAIPLNPATLLSLVRSQIDLLIEQQINATFWVKLPPGKIWCQELLRYQSSIRQPINIYNCQIKAVAGENKDIAKLEEQQDININQYAHQIDVQLLPNNQLSREYFLLVLSPRFSSLIVAYQQIKQDKSNNLGKENTHKNLPLLTITTIDSRVIQRVLDGLKKETTSELNQIVPTDLICQNVCDPTLVSLLFAKQIQRQDEINRQIRNERIAKLQGLNQTLQKKEQQKDEYLNNVCQELRTPLTQMKTALSLLNSPNLKPQQRQRYLQMLNTQCDRQSTLITSLLDLVELEQTLEATNLELVKLSEIVPGVVSTYQPVAQEKGIMLAYTVPTDLPAVWCVNGGLRQIVIHLLHNSLKFTPNGGEVWVKAKMQGEYVQLEVRDTGIGIAESEIPRIFECFYRVRSGTSEEMSGAGLGLTIVQRLLWNCGGSITAKSRPDEGSTFTVQLVPEGKEPVVGGKR
ncbi:signal transduction histidine kinase [Nostoc sp. PCC 7524]|uniref:DICT sensory domain-containing protein n=1 Tax=Nostoc sp. (strain ATCC 29411 / PCC 7524) TaxID=28072 RepID=UPI00029F20AF|nr:DICT sensory domain-containing protein [Nostoc sp. PCC 7524]AFY46320.1 signal transduction histidine kinase [Nostoc sp. PCC 7524]